MSSSEVTEQEERMDRTDRKRHTDRILPLSRRGFLAGALAAPGAAALASMARGAEPATRPSGPAKLKISILSYSFRGLLEEGKMDVFGYLETCKYRYGLDAADIWTGFLPHREEPFIRKVREALDDRELTLVDLCVDGAHVWEDKPEDREKNHQNALDWLKVAGALGARFMRTDAGGRADTWTDEQFDHIVRRYKEYAQFAGDHGFRVGAENHWGAERTWANLKKLYEAVGHPAFGLSLHIGGWSGSEAERAAADRDVAPWVRHTHIAWDICNGPLEEKLAPLWNAGYDGSYSVEHHSAKNEYRNVAIQLAQVRSVLERFRTGQSPLVKRV
jgi:sugar phosphate isomerase/epimerase